MKYFISFIFRVDKENFFRNEVLEVDKRIRTMDDIRNIEEKIMQKLNGLIKENVGIGINKEIDDVQIINYKEIEEQEDRRTEAIMGDNKVAENSKRKKTTMPGGFESGVQKLNKNVLRLLGEI